MPAKSRSIDWALASLSVKCASYLKASLCEAMSLLSEKEALLASLLAMDL